MLRKDVFLPTAKLIFAFLLYNILLMSSVIALENPVVNQNDSVTLFLETLLLREAGLYTLLGSKPMTEFDVTSTCGETEEDMVRSYKELSRFLELAKHDSEHYHANGVVLPDYEEFKKKSISRGKALKFLDKKKVWDGWLNANEITLNPIYKLITRGSSNKVGLFINVPQMMCALKKYQNEFTLITGVQFDVATILDSIEENHSVFWEKVFSSHYLHGLLLGYGEKNAYLFDWVRKQSLPLNSVSILRFPELTRFNQYTKKILKKDITVNDLPIPYFVSFEINDEEVERYSKERERILNFLKDKDFVSFSLQCLDTKERDTHIK